MVSFRAKFFMKIMKLMSLKEEGVLDIEKQRKDLENNVFLFRKPRKMKVQSLEINGISAEWLHQKDQIEDRAILYLHGGSYNAGSLNTHRSLAARIGKVSSSPLYADLKGLPLLIQTGTAEIILDDSTRFAEEAEKSGVKVILDLWAGMFHVFQIFGNLMPESKKALEKIGDFIKENFS